MPALQLLLAAAPASVSRPDNSGRLALHHAAAASRWTRCTAPTQLLLTLGTALAVDVLGETPLHAAAAAGHGPTIELLLQHAPQAAAMRAVDGGSPLHAAAAEAHEATVDLLRECAGACCCVCGRVGGLMAGPEGQPGQPGPSLTLPPPTPCLLCSRGGAAGGCRAGHSGPAPARAGFGCAPRRWRGGRRGPAARHGPLPAAARRRPHGQDAGSACACRPGARVSPAGGGPRPTPAPLCFRVGASALPHPRPGRRAGRRAGALPRAGTPAGAAPAARRPPPPRLHRPAPALPAEALLPGASTLQAPPQQGGQALAAVARQIHPRQPLLPGDLQRPAASKRVRRRLLALPLVRRSFQSCAPGA